MALWGSRGRMIDSAVPFEASASAIGYVYQLRKALYSCLERHGRGLDWFIAIEAADDIEELVNGSRALYQLKHRAEGVTMSDYSPDLWKTLRIWAYGVSNGQLNLDETDLFLLTTADLVVDSAGYLLQPAASKMRDETRALAALEVARKASKSKENRKAYEAFDALSSDERRDLLARIQVIANAPDVDEVEDLLLERVVAAVGHAYARPFLQRLEGWFYQRTIRQLRTEEMDAVTGNEFDQVFTDLRNQFRPENLPIDDDIALLQADPSDYEAMVFVRQLDIIDIGKTQLGIAVRDYIRAFTQRSKWSEDNLLLPGEISKYERRLIEEWKDLFAEMEDNLGSVATEIEKIAAAKKIYRWAMREARPRIRVGCDEPFVSKGSFHILADDLQLGWHIDFLIRLMTVLEPA